MMTWHWLIYIFAFFLSGSVYILYSQYEAFFLFAVVCGLPVISLLFLLIGQRLTEVCAEDGLYMAACGDMVYLPIAVKNHSRLPLADFVINVREANEWGEITADRMLSSDSFIFAAGRVDYGCRAVRCGRLEVRIDSVRFYDLLQLFSYRRRTAARYTVLVMPQLYQSFGGVGAGRSSLQTAVRTAGETAGVRPYQYGDSSRYIHWKASTAHDDVYMKDFYGQEENNSMLLFDVPTDADEKTCNGIYEIFYAAGVRLVGKYGSFIFGCAAEDGFFTERRIGNTAELDRQLAAYMQSRHAAGPMPNLQSLADSLRQDCRRIFYVTAAPGNGLINCTGALSAAMVVFLVGTENNTASGGNEIFIDKNDIAGSLAEVWQI